MIGTSIVMSVLAGWQASGSVSALRLRRAAEHGEPLDERALRTLRRQLDQLPEINHPLGH